MSFPTQTTVNPSKVRNMVSALKAAGRVLLEDGEDLSVAVLNSAMDDGLHVRRDLDSPTPKPSQFWLVVL